MPSPRLTAGSANRRLPRAAVNHPPPPTPGRGSVSLAAALAARRAAARSRHCPRMNPAELPAPAECAQGESRGSAGAAACDAPSAGIVETGWGAGAGGGGEPLGGRAGKVSVGQGRYGGGTVINRAPGGWGGAGPRVARLRGGGCGGLGRGEGSPPPGPLPRGGRRWGEIPSALGGRGSLPIAGMLIGANGIAPRP